MSAPPEIYAVLAGHNINAIDIPLGVTLHKGWARILDDLLHALRVLGWQGQIMQIKEKMGALRFYTTDDKTLTKAQLRSITDAEDRSRCTCEVCGQPGTLQYVSREGNKLYAVVSNSYLVKTVCAECAPLLPIGRQRG